jgi:Double zinc ribbon domain
MTCEDPAADAPQADRAAIWRAALRHGRGAANAALDIVFPPACLACRKAVAAHGALCPACWRRVGFIEKPYCERLGTPFAYDLGVPGLQSPEAMANPPVYQRARAVARFEDGPVRALIHRLKYGDRMELAKPLGLWMARAGAELLAEADLLVPAVASAPPHLAAIQSGAGFGGGHREGKRQEGRSVRARAGQAHGAAGRPDAQPAC